MVMIFRRLHRLLVVASMVFFFLLLWPPLYYCSRKPTRYNGMIRLRRAWAFLSSLCVGILYKFEFEEPVDWSKTYVVCPNHSSNLDTSMVCMLLKNNQLCFMGKQELLDSVVTAIYFKTIDIPVNRDSKMSSYRAFKAAADKLKNGVNMIMFPEGGIANDYPPRLQPFKNGPFRLAIELKIPIIPVSSLNTWKIMWDDGSKYGSRPGICKIFVHKPVETAHLSIADADALRDEVYKIIEGKLGASVMT